MKSKKIFLFIFAFAAFSCSSDSNPQPLLPVEENKVLLLIVDYTTNVFEGGKELAFGDPSDAFTVTNQHVPASDFGSIKLFYQEADALLFDGEIHWNGHGEILYPENILPASQFDIALTFDYVSPGGFENVLDPNDENIPYQSIWGAVQPVIKVRQYLRSNPDAIVKILLYTPSVGIGNPADWKWVLLIKN